MTRGDLAARGDLLCRDSVKRGSRVATPFASSGLKRDITRDITCDITRDITCDITRDVTRDITRYITRDVKRDIKIRGATSPRGATCSRKGASLATPLFLIVQVGTTLHTGRVYRRG